MKTKEHWKRSSFCSSNGDCVEVTWHKSAACSVGANCVEIANDEGGLVHVRDSKDPNRHLTFGPREWEAFIAGAKAGEFG